MAIHEPNDSEPEVDPFEPDEWSDDPRDPRDNPDDASPEDAPEPSADDREHRVVRRPNPLPSREEEEEELAEADIQHELDLEEDEIGEADLDV
jgi:hypothetical protein